MKVDCWIANSIWHVYCLRENHSFLKAVRNCRGAQQEVLTRILRQNTSTLYGRRHEFANINSIEDFQQKVPITGYKDYVPYVERIKSGEADLLTTGVPKRLHLSSGSSAPSKLLPFTDELRAEFSSGIRAWIYSLYSRYSTLKSGSAYFALTPLGQSESSSAVPIGFDQDSSYLSSVECALMKKIMAVPDAVQTIPCIEAAAYITLLFLLADRDIRWFSIWSPTFLTSLLERVETWQESLLSDLKVGTVTLPAQCQVASCTINIKTPCDRKRAKELENIFHSVSSKSCDTPWERIWPHLALISCWTDGWARIFARELKRSFPETVIQSKGLLATEGFVSLPYIFKTGVEKHLLSIRSHFFEFLSLEDGQCYLADQLVDGQHYEVLLTTSGGLYRYRLDDRICVEGFTHSTPHIRFVKKTELVSDLCGEKLNVNHIEVALENTFRHCGLTPSRYFLAPDIDENGNRYVLFLDAKVHDEILVSRELDRNLHENFHYRYCRSLGQLRTPRTFTLASNSWEAYMKLKAARQSVFKPSALETSSGWSSILAGEFNNADA